MDNNDIFKKLRVALQLRDDQIVEICELVNFRISKPEIGAFFRNADHPNYMECGDQVLRNFLNGLVIHLRGTKENPKNAADVIAENSGKVKSTSEKPKIFPKSAPIKSEPAKKSDPTKKPYKKPFNKTEDKPRVVENVRFKNGK